MCPFSSLPPGEGPDRFSPSSVKDWQPRRKSVSNACERCRRRKIRCDGDTPCATCSRFSLPCIRSQKSPAVVASEHQAALESRIHQLESQLAAHVNAPMHGMESIDENIMAGVSSYDFGQSPPPLTVNTDFATTDMDMASFSAGSSSIPSIAISEFSQCQYNPEVASPSSQVPSLYSGTTGTSSPDLPPTSAPVNTTSQPFSPSGGSHTAPSWEFMLKPQMLQDQDLSRRTSVSSLSLDSDDANVSPFPELDADMDLMPLTPAPRLPRQGIFAPQSESPPPGQPRPSYSDRSRAIGTIPFPSRFEAETLISEFVHHIESVQGHKPYSITPALFGRICETVYPDPSKKASSVDSPVSIPMARFHVFFAMAIGMKVRIKDSNEQTNALLDRCYELAMQQASSALFWQETGAIEAAQLLSVFASVRKELPFAPKSLQTSFSW